MAKSRNRLRDEYNEMVGKINRQLRTLAKHDPDTPALSRWRGYFQKVTADNPNRRTISKLRSEASKLLRSGQLSIESQERSVANAIQRLHEDGYTFINRRNFNSFMRFLDDARARGLGSMYSSEQIIEAIYKAKKKGLSRSEINQNIDRWSKQIKYDREGKQIEVEQPKPLNVRRYGNKRK